MKSEKNIKLDLSEKLFKELVDVQTSFDSNLHKNFDEKIDLNTFIFIYLHSSSMYMEFTFRMICELLINHNIFNLSNFKELLEHILNKIKENVLMCY